MTTQTSRNRNSGLWWLGAAAFLIGLVAFAPAALIECAINRSPGANVRFSADSGTIWSGSGRIAVASAAAQLTIPVTWRFDTLALQRLRLGFVVQIQSPALSGSTRVGLRFGDIELRETSLDVDARLLTVVNRAAALISPTGRLRLQQSNGEILGVRPASNADEAWRFDGAINLHAEQLALGGVVKAPVGTHEISLLGEGTTIRISVLRSGGPLKLEGKGTVMLAQPRQLNFAGFATAAGEAPAALKQLGPIAPDGRQRIEFNTTW